METPEKIKKGLLEALETASWVIEGGDAHDLIEAVEQLHASCADAWAYIQQLEKERDAAKADIETVCGRDEINTCAVCGHWRADWEKPGCELNGYTCMWVWRGVKE